MCLNYVFSVITLRCQGQEIFVTCSTALHDVFLVRSCVLAVVPGPSGRLHPAGVGKGSSVSMGQQPGAGGCVSVAAGPSF